jgi:DNA-binding transcriptional ArsR family regulator
MLRIHFTLKDLARVTISPHPDPLWEIVLSGFRLHEPRSVKHRPWLLALRSMSRPDTAAVKAGSAVLDVLAPLGPYFPDFLTPPGGRRDLDAGLDAVHSTPRRELRRQLSRLAERRPLPAWVTTLSTADPAAMTRLVRTLRAYHNVAIAPCAELIEQSVAADHAHRTHRLLNGGLDGLLASLRPVIRWSPPRLEVDYGVDRDLHLNGRGLQLVPSYFCRGQPLSLADPDLPPVLVYPIAQQFALSPDNRQPESLDKLVGATRGSVLRTIGAGVTTTQLARRVNASLAVVSRHADVLRNAGLVRRERDGAAVLHTLTALGRALVEAEQR